MSLLYPLHPRLVHFPIALLLTGSLSILVFVVRRRPQSLETLGWGALLLGWLSLFFAVLSGLIDQNQAPQEAAVRAILNPHTAAGYGLLVVYGLSLYERLRTPSVLSEAPLRWRLLLLLVLGMGLVLVEGWLGGQLVYDLGVGVSAP